MEANEKQKTCKHLCNYVTIEIYVNCIKMNEEKVNECFGAICPTPKCKMSHQG